MLIGVGSAWADGDGSAENPWTSGGCTVTLSGGVLTVSKASGTGAMADYPSLFDSSIPWRTNRNSITSIVVEEGVTHIGNYTLAQCRYATSISLPTTLTSIGDYAFQACNNASLTAIIIPDNVQTIGNYAFSSCTKATSITLPTNLTSIGNNAFATCSSLTSVDIPDKVMIIGEYAFNRCSNLETATVGNSVTTIGTNAFASCTKLESINIPASVMTIGASAFEGCNALTSFDVDANNNFYASEGGVLFNKDKTILIQYPASKSGSTYTIPASVTTINSYAFYYSTGLTEVTIPASVTAIGSYAFRYCSNLGTVTLLSNPYITGDAFTGIKSGATIAMNLTANAAGGAYWLTFYNQNLYFQADENTQIFKAALSDDKLTLTELTADKKVNAAKAVILKSTASTITMTLVTSNSSNDFNGNSLKGVATAVGKTSDGTTYVLNNGTQGVGFYRLATGKTLGVGKAYLTYDGALAPEFLGFGNETTGIDATLVNSEKVNSVVYDLQGRRVAQPTKGLYIVNGN